jgi:hypothetical protein
LYRVGRISDREALDYYLILCELGQPELASIHIHSGRRIIEQALDITGIKTSSVDRKINRRDIVLEKSASLFKDMVAMVVQTSSAS